MSIKILEKSTPASWLTELPPLGMDAKSIASDFRRYFSHTLGRDRHTHYPHYMYEALVLTLRDRLWERWKNTRYAYEENGGVRRAYYLSMEFLMGRALSNAMLNLGVDEPVHKALHDLGLSIEELAECENDAGLGNGGLGRLAACFMDSCATLRLPVVGYGIRYAYGMFRQKIENGYQIEEPDHWLRSGNLWDLERPEYAQRIKFGGRTEGYLKADGEMGWRWLDTHDVLAVPYDLPIPGYRNGTVNTLRLWSAVATDEFHLDDFNAGSYDQAVAAKNMAENITMVLYPNDATENGKELRLRQQYFLASASLQDVLRQWTRIHGEDFSEFAAKNCFQLNDTHPTIAVAELMRLLMDEHNLSWEAAWEIVSHVMAYTNHTLLPEALERWSVRLFRQLLPRLLDIIYEINARFLADVSRQWPGDMDRQARMSLIEEGYEQQVRMAYLAIVGSFSVNGVAALHSELLQKGLFHDFYEMWPEKFNNKTNGVTQRRWMASCNPGMNKLITEAIGPGWITNLDELRKLIPYADDAKFQARWRAVKQDNKVRLASLIEADTGVVFNTKAMFDVQVKRMHEYKRQLLNVLHVIHLYDRIKRGDTANWTPRCVLIGGKAAPGYYMAKQIIKLVNNVAKVINNDAEVGDKLKIAFLPNYRVTAMEVICPGTDLSEQISTAGKEASGTGNMKFMMNGAVTIGTLDGANIEIREEVGDDNFFLFGLTAEQVEERRRDYNPAGIIHGDSDIARVMHLLESNHFNQFEQGIFDPILHALTSPHDPWLTIADFRAFIDAQHQAALAYQDQEKWAKMSILNTACSGKFSTDRTMHEYNDEIWKLQPLPEMPLA
ncbi:MAG TPA: glycogen/starch/alpha-glucan phosphorylase [Candidatus Competibacteraceae bacterium]|nr:glycogen/starch/alpha-glucan phosphorylase [Candidatus Competibacteraceae bacterium]MCP5133725.1 glycogen/starch/alpha-glucan phosphorylase [Gammaproteobacteria bacterium]HPF59252.1 glycogen/starch/alpha-glucan phosphorylase [Candidatus Competibacteraceae bacterium]HRY18693.1 glycogen/starch/alpha-glucan phosphorylase [Candidatus Competibacteraceae bacterium]